MSTERVVIFGGGLAGLSAAYTLMKRGITPLLLEGSERAGGRGKRWVTTSPEGSLDSFVRQLPAAVASDVTRK